MTSHFISYFARRKDSIELALKLRPTTTPSSAGLSADVGGHRRERFWTGEPEENCAFCEIVKGDEPAFKVYEDEHCMAFLDILPIRPGHLLVVPKQHYPRVSDLPDEVSASIGRCVPRIARALCRAVQQPDFNIVSNQGYAQIVHHVHYHLVPAPFANTPIRSGWASLVGRDELDDDEAEELVKLIKKELDLEERESETPKLKAKL